MFINSRIKNNIEDKGINVFVKNHVSSTNDYLKYKYINDIAPVVIMTNNQRYPRGRRGSSWINYHCHSLSFTLCLKLEGNVNNYKTLSYIVGISILEVCKEFNIKSLKLKWPNDIMIDGKKVCGVLIENNIINKNLFFSAIGVGFNISIPDKLLSLIDGNVDNLNISSDKLETLIPKLIQQIITNTYLLKDNGFSSFKEKCNKYMYAKNENVILKNNLNEITGKLLGIDEDGYLEINTKHGIKKTNTLDYSLRVL
jgi:BirA family biotin operon repressor/biotin-[acetyl-CoA-carboxylase] ligase